MSTVITVENLGKKYLLRHQSGQQPYVALRDVLSDGVRNLGRKLLGRGDASARGAEQEEFWALRDVSFEVRQGDRIGIIGRNGAGKSTLLKILSRITEPTTGSVRIKGRVASLLEVGTGFHPELTGRENIFLNGAILGMGRAEIKRKFDEIVDFAEIEKFLDTPVKRYSSGMYVRLAFAVAAHLEPEILIVDEVLAVGDAQFQKKCLGKMEDVSAKEGRTVLFVSHNMGAVRSLCNRGILLAIGQVDYIGSPAAAIDRYQADIQDTHESAFMLHALKRYGHIGVQLRITRVLFNDGSGILHGKPLKIDIYFECLSAVDDVSLGIGFCNRDGVRIITIDSDINGVRANFLKGDAGLATVIVPQLHLEPDIYAIDVGARSGDTCALDYLPQCGHIAVMPSNVTSPVIAFREPGRGGMRLPTEWSFVLTEGDRHW